MARARAAFVHASVSGLWGRVCGLGLCAERWRGHAMRERSAGAVCRRRRGAESTADANKRAQTTEHTQPWRRGFCWRDERHHLDTHAAVGCMCGFAHVVCKRVIGVIALVAHGVGLGRDAATILANLWYTHGDMMQHLSDQELHDTTAAPTAPASWLHGCAQPVWAAVFQRRHLRVSRDRTERSLHGSILVWFYLLDSSCVSVVVYPRRKS